MAALKGLAFLLLVTSAPAAAQVPDSVPRDSAQAEQDTVDLTARYLEALARAKLRTPVVPHLIDDGPRPPTSLLVFDRQALEWATAETLGDLLTHVPGVYLWRGGWIGRPEYAAYQGRGATSVEYYLDGLPLTPVGQDSVAVDPATLSLRILDRVEIERWAGLLRVRLYTPRHDRLAAGSRIGVSTGDRDLARYLGGLERRYASGLGLGLAAEYWTAPTFGGTSSDAHATSVWVQGSYLHGERWGVQYQLVSQTPDRDPYVGGETSADTLGAGLKGTRSDMQLRVFLRREVGGTGRRIELVGARTSWSGSAIEQEINSGGLVASWRQPTWTVTAQGFVRSRWTPVDVRGSAGWVPTAFTSFNAEAAYQRHESDRQSSWIGGRAGIQLPAGFSLSGSARLGSIVASPAIETAVAQDIRDAEATFGWQRSFIGIEGSVSHTNAFQSPAPQPYLQIPTLAEAPAATWLTVSARIAPVQWLILESRYSDPSGELPDGQPPTHSLSTVTIRSKFLRTFPSGFFDLKVQLGMETWGDGILGRDQLGEPVRLDGATFLRGYVELSLGDFRFYYDRVNLAGSDQTYVPGFVIPRYGSTFGVRWDFLN